MFTRIENRYKMQVLRISSCSYVPTQIQVAHLSLCHVTDVIDSFVILDVEMKKM